MLSTGMVSRRKEEAGIWYAAYQPEVEMESLSRQDRTKGFDA